MTAKEMFEKLGYKLIQDDTTWLIYSANRNKYYEFRIEFFYPEKNIIISGKYPSYGKHIDLEELKAINKQIEELGWDNE